MASQPSASAAAPEDASKLLAVDGALFSYMFLLQMYSIGIVVFFILLYTHREEGYVPTSPLLLPPPLPLAESRIFCCRYWLVCAPFFPAIIFAAVAHNRCATRCDLVALPCPICPSSSLYLSPLYIPSCQLQQTRA
jgi:hypothetical protein